MLDHNKSRYLVRKEFFGGVVWDSEKKDYYLLSEENIEHLMDKGQLHTGALNIQGDYRIIETDPMPEDYIGFPLRVHLGLIDKCETSCRHCFFSQVPSGAASDKLLSISEICLLIDEMEKYGCMELFIGGGEPFLRQDWREIFTHADSKGIQLFIFTNGAHFSPEIIDYLNSLSNIGYVSVSLEGYSEETYTI